MDGLQQSQARERRGSRSSSTRPRAPSRASTSMSTSRSAHQSSANSSTAQLASTLPPRPSTVVHHSHKHSHSSCRTPTTPRPQSTAPREPTNNGSHSAMSSYLQERLQRRREESERIAAARLAQDLNNPVEPIHASRTAQSSPVKGSSGERRPQSSGGSERSEPTKKKGMGVKEMEATVSTLHKQNFDLKLELYHRRERQTALEERSEFLEAEKTQLEDVNDKLLEELEKRDKAVQEAVQMIVLLEAQVEKLVKEREMVRQVEAAGFSRFANLETPALAPRLPEEDVKALNRMPSFLSEKSESTANLRKVYLGTQGSLLSLPKVSEIPSTAEYGHQRSVSKELRSPSLSDLSESSFTSVYGEKGAQDTSQAEGSPLPETAAPVHRRRTLSNASDVAPAPRTRMPTSARSHRSGSVSRQSTGTFQSLNDVVEQGSPLQRLERSYSSQGDSPSVEKTSRAAKSHVQKQARQEKRDGLRRVTTDGPGRAHYDHHILPPTPDTISTSTLRRFKPSNETLSHPQAGVERSYLALSEGTASTTAGDDKPEPIPEHSGGAPVSLPAPTPVANKVFTGGSYFANRTPLAPRPRSADETTVSHKKDNPWDSDDDDDASVRSLESSLDIWLQQGKEPKRRTGRESPDMFGFPSAANRWEPNAMYGQGASLAGGAPLNWPDPLDDLLPIQEALFGGSGPAPPPPNRRSSLHARTGSTSTAAPVTIKHPEPSNSKLRRAFSRATRRNSEESRIRPSVERAPSSGEGKQQTARSQYPPLSRPGTVTPRNHRRINSLWRRSIGGTVTSPSPAPASGQQEPAPEQAGPSSSSNVAARSNSMVGQPSWIQRGKFSDEDMRDLGATPPPIQRQPRRSSFVDGTAEGASVYDYAPQTPSTPVASHAMSPANKGQPQGIEGTPAGQQHQQQQGGGGASLGNGTPNSARRKWLPGFGRASSLRNRAG